ncbi:MAG: radical SAM protein [Chthonomonadales bacterium]|nr:radical SAM protein [Chthonomonadales bacterium]
MGTLTTARAGARMLFNHPELVGWYFRNKLRVTGLAAEQETGEGYARHPVGITFKPTLSCNLRCRMCSFVASGAVFTNPRDSLPLGAWKSVVDDVRPWRPYIWFTGGEPTLYPEFVPLVRYIKEQGMTAGVTTNGTTLRNKAAELLEWPMDMMVVSIDGRGEVHNHVRGNAKAFERTMEGVMLLQELKRKRGLAKPALIVNCALTPDNYQQAIEMVGVAEELGAEALNYQHLWQLTDSMVRAHNARWGTAHTVSYEQSGGMEPAPVDVEGVIRIVHEIKRQPSRIPVLFHPEISDAEIRTYYERPEVFVRRRPAACAWLNTDVLPNGDVSPCFDVICGNILDRPFREIWNGPEFRAHRARLGADGDFPICARCCAYWRRD